MGADAKEARGSQDGGAETPAFLAWRLQNVHEALDQLRAELDHQRTLAGGYTAVAGGLVALLGANADDILDKLSGSAKSVAAVTLLIGLLAFTVAFVFANGPSFPRRIQIGIGRNSDGSKRSWFPRKTHEGRPRLPATVVDSLDHENFKTLTGLQDAQRAQFLDLKVPLAAGARLLASQQKAHSRALVALLTGLLATFLVAAILIVELIP